VEQRVRGESLALVVLGATGDLAIKKLFPAVFSLHHQVRERSNGPRQGSLCQ
jgi:glucose-6-phosphate 1-dehydrogenase